MRSRSPNSWLQVALVLLTSSCMQQLAVGTQADIMELASPVVQEQVDFEFSRAAAPAALIQIEGLLRVSPDNEQLLLLGAKGFASFAYGFIEDDMEAAEARGDSALADKERARARAMYLKAKALGLRVLLAEEPDLASALTRDPDALKVFLTSAFSDTSAARALFWAGYAWGSAINLSRDDPALLADLALASALVERAVELDEGYYHAAGHIFLGVVYASRSTSIGGDPEKGRRHFERALALTGRKAFLAHVNYAQNYAVQTQNKQLFLSLVKEVLDAPLEAGTPVSLTNAIAQRRAERLLAQADALILDPLPAEAPRPPAPVVPETPAPAFPGGVTPAAPSETEPAKPAARAAEPPRTTS